MTLCSEAGACGGGDSQPRHLCSGSAYLARSWSRVAGPPALLGAPRRRPGRTPSSRVATASRSSGSTAKASSALLGCQWAAALLPPPLTERLPSQEPGPRLDGAAAMPSNSRASHEALSPIVQASSSPAAAIGRLDRLTERRLGLPTTGIDEPIGRGCRPGAPRHGWDSMAAACAMDQQAGCNCM